MEEIHRLNMKQLRYRRLYRDINVHSVFSRAFLRTMTLQTPCTISQFVQQLQSRPNKPTDEATRISEAVMLAEEVLGDLLEDGGRYDSGLTELMDGMTVVLNCSLKGHLPVEIYEVPVSSGERLMEPKHYSPLMTDLTDVLIENNPPVFQDTFLKKFLICVNNIMGDLQPFPLGIHSSALALEYSVQSTSEQCERCS